MFVKGDRMAKKDSLEIYKQHFDIYSGILFNNQIFEGDNTEEIIYEFDCPEFEELRSKYDLVKIAGKGSDFIRAKRLLHYLAPKLAHSSWYTNHIECNSLRLLEYSLNNPEQGINCLNKSKILVECCLALGIYARRICIMPYSPYDFDSHVVSEIFDRDLGKWIMLDPTTDGYFVDERKIALSLVEMRSRFANSEFITFVPSTATIIDLEKLRRKYFDKNAYICKNLFYFKLEKYNTFGDKGINLHFVPINYSLKITQQANLKYRIDNLPIEYEYLRKKFEEDVAKLTKYLEPKRIAIDVMTNAPV